MSCLAIKTTEKFCRNYAQDGCDFCHIHKDITNEVLTRRWKGLYIEHWRNALLTPFGHNPSHNTFLLIKRGYVVLTKKDIESIPPLPTFIDIYIALVEEGVCEPTDNMLMFACAVKFILTLQNNGRIGAAHYLYNFTHYLYNMILNSLILKNVSSFKAFIDVIIILTKSNIQHVPLSEMFGLMVNLLDTPTGREFSWHAEDEGHLLEIASQISEYDVLKGFLCSRFLPEIREVRQTEKGIQRAKMDHLKEELMAVAWHPDRMIKYLDMGWEMEDM